MQQIQAADDAFAAILDDGSVVSWGSADLGGDSSAAQGQLKNVQQIHATESAFAAILGMVLLSHGVMLRLVATAVLFRISSKMCSRFKPLRALLLPFFLADPVSPGVVLTRVATVVLYGIS